MSYVSCELTYVLRLLGLMLTPSHPLGVSERGLLLLAMKRRM